MKKPDQEEIDQYLRKELSPEHKQAFEAQLNADADLAKEVAVHREAIALARSMGDHRTKETIRRAMEKAAQGKGANNRGRNIGLLLLALAATAFSIFYFSQQTERIEEPAIENNIPIASLYDANYQSPNLTFGNRGDAELLAAASIAYNQKDFQKALVLFEQVAATPADAKVILAKSICYLELEQYDQAKQLLLTALDDPLYGDQCRWYLGLLLLKQEDPQAIQQFTILSQSNNGFQQAAAKKIVEQLKK